MNKSLLTTEELARRYRGDVPWRALEEAAGVSRTALWQRLRRAGVEMGRRHPPVEVACAACGVVLTRKVYTLGGGRRVYCSRACYLGSIRTGAVGYVQHRCGQKAARKVVERVFPLKPGMVVHHWDKNNDNNRLENLAVFATNADHTSFHRGGPGRPVWDGREQDGGA